MYCRAIFISLFPDHGSKTDTLINLANQAMYQAKHSGSGNIRNLAVKLLPA